jgi:hypothetical protein
MSKNKNPIEYLVVRDGREKKGHGWIFDKSDECLGMEAGTLHTGDYSIKDYTELITIERKYCTNELAINIFEKRFEEELKRLDDFRYPYMIFEFDYEDVLKYPLNSGLPKHLWHKTAMTADIMNKTIARYQTQYKTKVVFAGKYGKQMAEILFRQFMKYGKKD